jgi:hypothetical protein
MYGASRLSPIGCAFYTFMGITIVMLVCTWLTFRVWRVETTGIWTTGQIVAISHCHDRHNQELATVNLNVAFTDTSGAGHVSQTDCEYDTVKVGQSIAIRYIPGDPDYILTRDDIGGGQGFPLLVLTLIDIVCVTIVTLVAALAIRASRRAKRVQRTAKGGSAALGTHAFPSARRRNPVPDHQLALSHRVRRALSRSHRPVE